MSAMRIVRYWSRKGLAAVYLAAALLLTMLYTWQADLRFADALRMLPVIFGYLLLLRTADDWFDYKKDSGKKTQHLRRQELLVMFGCISLMMLLLHLYLFGLSGICCLAAIAYLLLMNRAAVLKCPYLALLFALYDLLNGTAYGGKQAVICLSCLFISAVYAVIKRKSK